MTTRTIRWTGEDRDLIVDGQSVAVSKGDTLEVPTAVAKSLVDQGHAEIKTPPQKPATTPKKEASNGDR